MLHIVGDPQLEAYILLDALGSAAIDKVFRGYSGLSDMKVSRNR
jgi:hypothetical protein